jgi:hypothetical protein
LFALPGETTAPTLSVGTSAYNKENIIIKIGIRKYLMDGLI